VKEVIFRIGAAILLAFAIPLAIPLATAQEKTMVTLGTSTPGGDFPVYGEA
jgi:hypothetical protein